MHELDLSKGNKGTHPDIQFGINNRYLVKVHDQWYFGYFVNQWFGLVFWSGSTSYQFDTPGYNNSKWERVIEFIPEDDIDKLMELQQIFADWIAERRNIIAGESPKMHVLYLQMEEVLAE